MTESRWVWTTAGWCEYLACPALSCGEYNDYGLVGESNVRVFDRLLDDAPNGVNSESVYLGRFYVEDRAAYRTGEPYVSNYYDVPEPVDVLLVRGDYGHRARWVRADSPMAEHIPGDYPIIDDEDHSELVEETCAAAWEDSTLRDRVHYLRNTGLSHFASRLSWSDLFRRGARDGGEWSDDTGSLRDALVSR